MQFLLKFSVVCLLTSIYSVRGSDSNSVSNFLIKWFCWPFGQLCDSNFFSNLIPWADLEVCDDNWVRLNVTPLNSWFQDKLYGQHLVKFIVSKHLEAHIAKIKPTKALAMSFHGKTGSGKTYVAQNIVNTLYKKGSQSRFVHWYFGSFDFPNVDDVKKYHAKLLKEIPQYARMCGRSLFVFDEIDKIPEGVIDVLKPFLGHYTDVDGIDYRSNIFIFLSNSGENLISDIAFNVWLEGKDREDIGMNHVEPAIQKAAFTETGGLQNSEVIGKKLVDVFVPFLPLERQHIKMCIADELRKLGFPVNENVENIADQFTYYPPNLEIFSESGCKKIPHKVSVHNEM